MSAQAVEALPLVPSIKETILDRETIARRVTELGREISRDYQGKEVVLIGILKGAYLFASDLTRAISIPCVMEFVSISRYRRSSGFKEVRLIQDVEIDLSGRHVILVEDIVDTGLTLHYLVEELSRRSPHSIEICSLLDRPELRLADIPLRYVGFNVSEEFLVGYGLDFRERYRGLPFIATLDL